MGGLRRVGSPLTLPRSLAFLVPGDLTTRTGGYAYDRRIIAGLRSLGWTVDVHALDGTFPFPTTVALEHAKALLATLRTGTPTLIDGLAFGAMPDLVEREAGRLKLMGLVHHPLAHETGLDARQVLELEDAERRSLGTARAVIVTSAATGQLLADYRVPRERITVVAPGTERAPLARGSGSRVLALLCVATLTPRKGHDVLFAALAGLREYEWHLTCVGDAMGNHETLPRMRAQLATHGIANRVSFAAGGDDATVSEAYHHADVFVLPTRYEGYGMVVAEALACGLPVISTRTGAIPELVGDAAGLVVPPGDGDSLRRELRRLFEEPELLPRLQLGAREARERLPQWSDSCARLSAVLEQLARS